MNEGLFQREVEAIQRITVTSSNYHWLRAWMKGLQVSKETRLIPGYFGKTSDGQWIRLLGGCKIVMVLWNTKIWHNSGTIIIITY